MCDISDDGFVPLVNACTTLIDVNLAACKKNLSDKALKNISKLKNLQTLNLRGTNATEETVEKINTACLQLKSFVEPKRQRRYNNAI